MKNIILAAALITISTSAFAGKYTSVKKYVPIKEDDIVCDDGNVHGKITKEQMVEFRTQIKGFFKKKTIVTEHPFMFNHRKIVTDAEGKRISMPEKSGFTSRGAYYKVCGKIDGAIYKAKQEAIKQKHIAEMQERTKIRDAEEKAQEERRAAALKAARKNGSPKCKRMFAKADAAQQEAANALEAGELSMYELNALVDKSAMLVITTLGTCVK